MIIIIIMGITESIPLSNCLKKSKENNGQMVICDNLSENDIIKLESLNLKVSTIPHEWYGIDWGENGAWNGPDVNSEEDKWGQICAEWRKYNRKFVEKSDGKESFTIRWNVKFF